ncbi:hypothetical protein [Trichormus variabilis]|uniref:Uncharacterized protein n=1 Tax=Trichormus variabilis SAG 1403-4b TaxID=447716 RepID=A0A433UMI0_ANAVA|nr:hypothetical protein [Trichormus variabilis]RUS95048.1 hypothetical protein DSM107003_32480 [Trichormus variabilis SAG 1403-4b]
MLKIKAKISVSMKTTQVIKIALIPILAISTLLSISKTALADYLRSEGFGGEYRYELCSTDDGSDYYLKIWDKNENPQKDSYSQTRSFKSSREALIHFDCNYANNSLPECPK